MTLNKMTLNKMTLNKMTLNKMTQNGDILTFAKQPTLAKPSNTISLIPNPLSYSVERRSSKGYSTESHGAVEMPYSSESPNAIISCHFASDAAE
jgi:hypothetical protein